LPLPVQARVHMTLEALPGLESPRGGVDAPGHHDLNFSRPEVFEFGAEKVERNGIPHLAQSARSDMGHPAWSWRAHD
jgi:hypothetical protein